MLMKRLMDRFDALNAEALKEDRYEDALIFTSAESWANNCHGLTPQRVIEHMRTVVAGYSQTAPESVQDALTKVVQVLDEEQANLEAAGIQF